MMRENPWYIKYTLVLAGVILTIYAMIEARTVLLPLLFAIFFSVLLAPVCNRLERLKIPGLLAILITISAGLLLLGGLGFLFYTQIVVFADDVTLIQERVEELIEGFESFIARWLGSDTTSLISLDELEASLIEIVRNNTDAFTRGLAGAASFLTAAFLVPVYMFLMLWFRDFLEEFLMRVFAGGADEDREMMGKLVLRIKLVVQHYITGILTVILILAVLNSITLMVIGVNHAIFFGTFAAMLNVIPFIGPIIGSLLPIVYSILTMDSLIYPVVILASFYVIQIFEANLFTPVIVGSRVSLNALITLLLLFIGAQVWGLAGMILFIPIGAVLKVVFDEVESLKPYGFLMGRVPDKSEWKKGPLARRISRISGSNDADTGIPDQEEEKGQDGG
ncbi:MAG: AI-2E family transporter [Balneolaceae bacterium]